MGGDCPCDPVPKRPERPGPEHRLPSGRRPEAEDALGPALRAALADVEAWDMTAARPATWDPPPKVDA
jgi:hypothetical protein